MTSSRSLRSFLAPPAFVAPVALALGLTLAPTAAEAAKLITGKNIKDSSITTADIKNGSLLSADFKAGQVPRGAAGTKGATGARGFSAWDTIPAGVTVTGRFYDQTPAVVANQQIVVNQELPATAPVALANSTVAFGAGFSPADVSPECTGSYSAPSAPAGMVCIYLGGASGFTSANAYTWTNEAQRKNAFYMAATGPATAGTTYYYYGVWAYTAPSVS